MINKQLHDQGSSHILRFWIWTFVLYFYLQVSSWAIFFKDNAVKSIPVPEVLLSYILFADVILISFLLIFCSMRKTMPVFDNVSFILPIFYFIFVIIRKDESKFFAGFVVCEIDTIKAFISAEAILLCWFFIKWLCSKLVRGYLSATNVVNYDDNCAANFAQYDLSRQ